MTLWIIALSDLIVDQLVGNSFPFFIFLSVIFFPFLIIFSPYCENLFIVMFVSIFLGDLLNNSLKCKGYQFHLLSPFFHPSCIFITQITSLFPVIWMGKGMDFDIDIDFDFKIIGRVFLASSLDMNLIIYAPHSYTFLVFPILIIKAVV